VLQEDDTAERDVEIVEARGARPPKSAGRSSVTSQSQEGIEVITSGGAGHSPTKIGGGLGSVWRRSGGKLRNRSPSPVRHWSDPKQQLAASNNIDENEDTTSGDSAKDNNVPNNSLLEKEETASSAASGSFFGAARGIRNMSPGRVKRSLKKRLIPAIPASPRQNHHQHPSSQSSNSLATSSPEKPSLPLYPTIGNGGSIEEEEDDEEDGVDHAVVTNLAHTTMSFDVGEDLLGSSNSPNHREESALPTTTAPLLPIQPVLENDVESEQGYYINTTSFNIFESREFLRAFGGRASEASVCTNYIRTGDGLCHAKDGRGSGSGGRHGMDKHELEDKLERSVQAYYAGLGKVLARIKEWLIERQGQPMQFVDVNGNYIPPQSTSDTLQMTHQDLLEAAHNPELNILILAMSSILLRAGNAHFQLKRFDESCRDYVSAQSYSSIRHEAKDIIAQEKAECSVIHVEDAKLNGRISNNMASAKSKLGMFEESRAEYTKALHIKQSTLEAFQKSNNNSSSSNGSKRDAMENNLISDVASTFHNIGLLRMNCGEPKKAEKAYKQSLSLRVKKFGLDDLGVSSTLRALGDLYYQLHQYDDAFRSYKESLRIWKVHVGKKVDLRTAELYYNIGMVFYSKGPYIKARMSMAECLRIRRLLCSGKERLPVASALHLFGLIAMSSGNYDEALSLLEEALEIRQQLMDSHDHLLLLNSQVALGMVHYKLNNLDNAMDCFSVALEGRMQRLGTDHISVSEVLQGIGDTYSSAEEYQKAFQTLEEVLRIRKAAAASGGNKLEVAETLNSLSLILFKSGDIEKAIELSEEALELLKSGVDFDHLLVGKALKNIGDYYQETEAYDDAMEAYSESLRIMTAWYGREHVFLSEVLNEIGVTRFKNGEYMVAKHSFTEALRLMRLTHTEDNKSAIFPTLNHLGHALYKNNELKQAAETYIESFNMQVSIVTGDANDGLKEFGTKLNTIKERIASMEQKEDEVSELSESLGGIASVLRYLGLVIQEQGDFEAALSANKLSLSVRLCQPFKEHAAIALMAETIAMFEYKRNNLESAMDYFNQALESKKLYQGESTIDVARTVNNLANIHFSLGNLDDAMGLYQEALEIKRHCLGDDSDEVANTLNNIAHVMVNAGKEQEALSAYHNVVKIRQDRYGKSHVSVATTLASMGDVYIKLGQLDIAMTYLEQCIRIQKLRQDHCDERVLENLGSIYGKLGEWHKAESTFKQIIELKRASHGNECIDIAKTLDLLAVSYIEQDRYEESIEHLQEALRVRKACLDEEDDEILASLNKLAFVFKSLDMTEQMLEVRAEFEALQERRKVHVDNM